MKVVVNGVFNALDDVFGERLFVGLLSGEDWVPLVKLNVALKG